MITPAVTEISHERALELRRMWQLKALAAQAAKQAEAGYRELPAAR